MLRMANQRFSEVTRVMGSMFEGRPVVPLAAAGAVLGVAVGLALAARRRPRPRLTAKKPALRGMAGLGRGNRRVPFRQWGYYTELLQLGYRLLQNPLVRAFVVSTLVRRLRRARR